MSDIRQTHSREERTLTDADVEAIAAKVESRIADKFVRGAGLGVLRMAWRGVILAIILLAAYSFAHSGRP